MSDAVFKNHFRFKKESVRRITWLIEDDLKSQNQRGHPLALILQVCLALLYFASGSFKRVVALCGSVSYSACWWAIQRDTYALCRRKKRYIRMPSDLEMAATARRMYARFGLPRFALVPHGQFQEVLTRRTTSAASSSML
jgi:hypothetical protein